jgi:hypothetical protein
MFFFSYVFFGYVFGLFVCWVFDAFNRNSAWGRCLELLLRGPMLTVLRIKVKQEIPGFVEN